MPRSCQTKRAPIHFALLLAAFPGFASADDLIGSEIPPYPANLEEVIGACVAGPPRTTDICDYSIGVLRDRSGTSHHVYAGKFVRRDDKGSAYWLVTDAIPLSRIPKGYQISVSTCRLNGVEDSTIVAVVKTVDEEWLKNVLRAFRLDLKKEKFLSLEPRMVDCLNEGWGA